MKADVKKIREMVAEILEVDISEIGDDSNFISDLAMNSLQMIDCIAELEDSYGIRIPREDILNLDSVNNVVKYIEGIKS